VDTNVVQDTTYHYAVESCFAGESKITASKAITAKTIPTVIGEYFFGGYYVGNITTPDGTYAVIFADEEADVLRQWKTANNHTPGTFSDVDGWANTQLMTADSALRPPTPPPPTAAPTTVLGLMIGICHRAMSCYCHGQIALFWQS
jgi:hypothetical protein